MHAEWTKLRTVRGWVLGLAAAALVTVAFGLLPGMSGSCGQHGPASACSVPVGPGGELVSDSYYLVHQSLTGNGTITARVTALTGLIPAPPPRGSGSRHGPQPAGGQGQSRLRPGLVPWAKAGIILTAAPGRERRTRRCWSPPRTASGCRTTTPRTSPGARVPSPVPAPLAAADPVRGHAHRLRLGGRHPLGRVAAVTLAGFPRTIQAGLFATSPQYSQPASLGIVQSGRRAARPWPPGGSTMSACRPPGARPLAGPPGAPRAGRPVGGLSIGAVGNAPADLRGGYQQAAGRSR